MNSVNPSSAVERPFDVENQASPQPKRTMRRRASTPAGKTKKSISFPGSALLSGILGALLLIALAVLGYLWFFCRFYVPPQHMAIVTAKSGSTPKGSDILVERGEKGIWRDVLAEGRHFLDPFRYDVKIVPATVIPLGKVGIVTSKVGKELPAGEFIAPDHSYKGVWQDVLGPGIYRLNPEGYTVEITDALNIPIGYAGVVTSQSGKAPEPGKFAQPGQKGVLQDILQPGLYYLNRYAYQINIIEIGMNQVTMSAGSKESIVSTRNRLVTANQELDKLQTETLNSQQSFRLFQNAGLAKSKPAASSARSQAKKSKMPAVMEDKAAPLPQTANSAVQIFGVSRAVEFPSRDGFKVILEMTVEFELMPANIARIYLLYGDLPQVVEKIILPQVLSISRLKGSSYRAQEFIMGEGREKFQNELQQELMKVLDDKNLLIHNAIIRNVEIPENILSPIRAVSIAKEQNLTNVSLQQTAKKLAELNTEVALIEQRKQEVVQQTAKIVAEIAALRKQEVAQIEANTALSVAEIHLQKAQIEAQTRQLQGEAEVKAKFLCENEEALGNVLKAKVLGNGDELVKLRMIESLNPEVSTNIIYAGPGTLWTDLKNPALTLPAQQ